MAAARGPAGAKRAVPRPCRLTRPFRRATAKYAAEVLPKALAEMSWPAKAIQIDGGCDFTAVFTADFEQARVELPTSMAEIAREVDRFRHTCKDARPHAALANAPRPKSSPPARPRRPPSLICDEPGDGPGLGLTRRGRPSTTRALSGRQSVPPVRRDTRRTQRPETLPHSIDCKVASLGSRPRFRRGPLTLTRRRRFPPQARIRFARDSVHGGSELQPSESSRRSLELERANDADH